MVSTSVHGRVTVYESLYTGLNKTLLQLLAHLYQNVCVEGQFTVTVVLQQLQKGLSDCWPILSSKCHSTCTRSESNLCYVGSK